MNDETTERLYPFIGGIAKDLDCVPIAINGVVDHVHCLLRYPPDLSHSNMARHLKSRSSKWIHETFPSLSDFAWQEGYGGFTVSRSAVDRVATYVRNQKHHHATMRYEDEIMELLRRHGIEATPEDVLR